MRVDQSTGKAPITESERQYFLDRGINLVPKEALAALRTSVRLVQELIDKPIEELFPDEAKILASEGIDLDQWPELCKQYPIVSDPEPTGNEIADYFVALSHAKVQKMNPIRVIRGVEILRLNIEMDEYLKRFSVGYKRDWTGIYFG